MNIGDQILENEVIIIGKMALARTAMEKYNYARSKEFMLEAVVKLDEILLLTNQNPKEP